MFRGGTKKKGQVRRTTVRLQLVVPLLRGGTKKKGQVRRTTVSLHPSTCRWSVEVYVSQDPHQGATVVFRYIEGSFLVSKTGDARERYAPNTYSHSSSSVITFCCSNSGSSRTLSSPHHSQISLTLQVFRRGVLNHNGFSEYTEILVLTKTKTLHYPLPGSSRLRQEGIKTSIKQNKTKNEISQCLHYYTEQNKFRKRYTF